MRHRGLLLIGLAALAARTATILFRSPPGTRSVHPRPASFQLDPGGELAAGLKAAVTRELEPFAREEESKKLRGEPYVDLDTKFEYAPAYGPDKRVAISVRIGGPLRTDSSHSAGIAGGSGPTQSRYLIFTYALIGTRWVELAKPRWETRPRGRRFSDAPMLESKDDRPAAALGPAPSGGGPGAN